MSEAVVPVAATPTDWHGQAMRAASDALCGRAALPAARARRGPVVGRLPRLPAGHHDSATASAASRRPRSGSTSTSRAAAVPRSGGSAGRSVREQALAECRFRPRAERGGRGAIRPGAGAMFSEGARLRDPRRGPRRSLDPGAGRATLWLPASTALDVAAKGQGDAASEQVRRRARGRWTRSGPGFNRDLPDPRRRDRPDAGRHLGRAQGLDADDARHAGARLPDRRALGALSRGICAAEPLDRPDRGVDQQPRRGAFDHLRAARPRGVPQRDAPAALGAARRRPDPGADDHAGDRHRRAQRDQGGAAVDPRRRHGDRRQPRSRSCSTTCCRSPCPAS